MAGSYGEFNKTSALAPRQNFVARNIRLAGHLKPTSSKTQRGIDRDGQIAATSVACLKPKKLPYVLDYVNRASPQVVTSVHGRNKFTLYRVGRKWKN